MCYTRVMIPTTQDAKYDQGFRDGGSDYQAGRLLGYAKPTPQDDDPFYAAGYEAGWANERLYWTNEDRYWGFA